MGKKKPGEDWHHYYLGTGKPGEMMDRYGVAGTKSVKPSAQTSVSKTRTVNEVNQDIAGAMTNSYDTRRSMEAAALLGNKDAKKYAKKGFNSNNIFGAHETMGGLEKKYDEDYGAGLTHALVTADRKNFTKGLKKSDKDDDTGSQDQERVQKTSPSLAESIAAGTVSQAILDADARVNEFARYRTSGEESANRYTDNTNEGVSDDGYTQGRAFSFLKDYKLDLQSRYGK